MECKADFSILGVDNIFVRIGLDPCVISVLEIVLCACVFGVLNLAIYHAARSIITWVRWMNLKMSTQSYEDMTSVSSSRDLVGATHADQSALS